MKLIRAHWPRAQRLWLWTTLAAFFVTFGCAPKAGTPKVVPSGRRPNIIFILADDLDLPPLAHMPKLQAELVAKGTTFNNMFVTDSVCCPSRASILRAQYVKNHGVLDNARPIGGYKKFFESGLESSTMATWLKDAGYKTALIGKYLNQYPTPRTETHVPPGWDEWFVLHFPEKYYEYKVNVNGRTVSLGDTEQDYQTDALKVRVLDFIASNANSTQPYFVYLAPFAPHAPPYPADRHEGAFADLRAPRTPNFNETDVSGKPAWVRALPPLSEEVISATDEWFRNRVRTMQAVDDMIGAIVQALAARGELSNTYIFFTSDNGFQMGGHRMDHGKGDPYEESLRVPLIVRGPGVPAARKLEHIVLNIDFGPTFAELAGGSVPDFVDGRSMASLLGNKPPAIKDWRSDFMVEHRVRSDADGIPEYVGLHTRRYAYFEYPEGEKELYDLVNDPYQLKNIHTGADPALVKRLTDRLEVLKNCAGETCRVDAAAPAVVPAKVAPSPSPSAPAPTKPVALN